MISKKQCRYHPRLHRQLMGLIYAAEASIGMDEYRMECSAYREGLFGPAS
jgi:hypothetical protein